METVTLNLKWFNFSQNNSGGSFVVDSNVCEEVFIQATSAKQAVEIAEGFCDNSDSCECCGDRWSFYVDDSDGHEVPTMYGESILDMKKSYYRSRAKLHYYDGRVEDFEFKGA